LGRYEVFHRTKERLYRIVVNELVELNYLCSYV
jgi:hypothetical protein